MSDITIECNQAWTNTGVAADARPNTLLTPDFLRTKEYRTLHGFGTVSAAPMTKRILLAPRPLSRRG
ncbi:hypothetical protein [Enemella evansiae]|uniref:hypothetical protein n=1 Tax=Enemella evansiae TaxID=2016499 RepID=UPI000B969E45|nr:hypothetical protein [Enemella evansiae]OYO12544.1 hypothetical protein BI335_15290 [Enemella evansiae]TDO93468.1 hypothetical protein C8D81_1253 [Enemella evansiae]